MTDLRSTPEIEAARNSSTLEVYLLGVVDFEAAHFLQERAVYDISGRNDRQGALFLCEHPPMITVGREGSRAHILAEPHELNARLIELRWLNRGGGSLVHAPGQLAVYPVVPLKRLGIGLAEYRRILEEAVIDVCGEVKVPAFRRDGEPGVFSRCGQVAHVAAAVKSWVSWQGMFLNVSPSADLLELTRPNRSGERVSSLAAQRQRLTSMHKVRESLVRHLAARLGYETYHLYTGHPLLKRTRRKVHVHA